MKSPIETKNLLLNKKTPLTSKDKSLFAYFGVGAQIKPPCRLLNPHRIHVGDRTSIQEYCNLNAFEDLSFLRDFISPQYRDEFPVESYLYDSKIDIGRETHIGRFFFASCTKLIQLDDNVLISERVFIGDNNHSFGHREVPIMQQPNKRGEPIRVKYGTWVGTGAALLAGTEIGKLSVVGANSVCKERFPDYSVIGPQPAKLLFTRFVGE